MAINTDLIEIGAGVLTIDPDGDAVTIETTEEGLTMAHSRTIDYVTADETASPLVPYVESEEATFSVVCKEFDAERLRLAMGQGTITTVAAGVGVKGSDTIAAGGSLLIPEHVLEYVAPRRVNPALNTTLTVYRAIAVSEQEITFRRTQERRIQFTFRALEDTTKDPGQRLYEIVHETAEATS